MLERVPFRTIRSLHRYLRRRLFTRERPTGEYVCVPPDTDVVRVLGRASFAPNWEFSYNYRGEDLNLARVVYDDATQHEEVWWQTHVRGWKHDDRWWLSAHYEPEPTEHPHAHLEQRQTAVDGMDQMEAVFLELAELPTEHRRWDG